MAVHTLNMSKYYLSQTRQQHTLSDSFVLSVSSLLLFFFFGSVNQVFLTHFDSSYLKILDQLPSMESRFLFVGISV